MPSLARGSRAGRSGKKKIVYQSEDDEDSASRNVHPSFDDHDNSEEEDDDQEDSEKGFGSGDEYADSAVDEELARRGVKEWTSLRTARRPKVNYRERGTSELSEEEPTPRVRKHVHWSESVQANSQELRATKSRLCAQTHDSADNEQKKKASSKPKKSRQEPRASHLLTGIRSESSVSSVGSLNPRFAGMRVAGYSPPNGPPNNIVEEYMSPNDGYVEDFEAFKVLTDAEKRDVIAREADENGLERPVGWNVSFHYNPHVEYHHFGSSHPMKPWRLTLTKQLVLSYGLEYTMDLYEPRPASFDELAIFHDRDYL